MSLSERTRINRVSPVGVDTVDGHTLTEGLAKYPVQLDEIGNICSHIAERLEVFTGSGSILGPMSRRNEAMHNKICRFLLLRLMALVPVVFAQVQP